MNTIDPTAYAPESSYLPTASYIGYFAALRPESIAFVDQGREITFSKFNQDVCRVVAGLRHHGLTEGQVAAVETQNHYQHCCIVLACEVMAVATLSYTDKEKTLLSEAIASVDLVISTQQGKTSHLKSVIITDPDWINLIAGIEPEHPLRTSLICDDTPLRIVKSSGTTGSLKQMVHTGRILKFRIDQTQFRAGFNQHSRFLISMGFTVQSYYLRAMACIRMGGVCVYDNQSPVPEVLTKYDITHALLLPITISAILNNLPKDYKKASNLTILTMGAPISDAIRARVNKVLGSELVEIYATNEISAICTMCDGGVGIITPGIQVQVVNDDENPVIGETGRIRVRSGGGVTGYIDDPETTREKFQDGWFYPGDIGVLEDEYTLRLSGRIDDLINFRGIKFSPQKIEDSLRTALPVTDLCITDVPNSNGENQLYVVVAMEESAILDEIKDMLPSLMSSRFGEVILVPVERIPRTSTGKIRRRMLNEAIKSMLNC